MMKTKLVDVEFKAIRACCERNPVEYIQNAKSYRAKYQKLDEIHFLFMDAYAYTRVGKYHLAEPILTGILGKAIIEKNPFFLVHGNLLLSLCFTNDPPKALSYLMIAEEYSRDAQDTLLLAACFAFQGDYYQLHRNYKQAEALHIQVQKLLENNDESNIKLPSLLSLANTSVCAKKYKNALQYLYKAMSLCKKTHNDQFQLTLSNNLANVLMALKRYSEAEEFLFEAQELSNKLNLGIHRIQVIFSLAVLKLKCKLPQQALTYLNECSDLSKEEGFEMPEFLLDLYNNYAIAHSLNGEIDQASVFLDKAVSIAIDIGDVVAEQEIYLNSAEMLMRAKHYDKAEALLIKCLQCCKKHKLQDHVFAAKESMAKLYLKQRDFPKCVNMMQKVQTDLHKQLTKIQDEYARIELQGSEPDKHRNQNTISTALSSREFIGISNAAHKVLRDALLAAQHPNVSVLICGESGTGKEVVANLIHTNSIRKYHPFVPINAAAISSGLVENELFGHKKGSYTGATSDAKGFFLQANKGTLFIDEITEMPIEFQSKLLRAIESRKVIPVGSVNEIDFDCRIVSSTNRNIHDLLSNNQFRIDLFHRINTIEIFIPPLRERIEDIPVLIDHFIRMFCKEFKWMEPKITDSFIQSLQEYSFPGNVRELKNIIERLFILGESTYWDATLLDAVCNLGSKFTKNDEHIDCDEKDRIIKALILHKGIRRDAAAFLKMSNSTMTRRIEKYCLEGYTAKQQTKKKTRA